MARKATAAQKSAARKLGIRVTKTVRGKRVELTPTALKAKIAVAKDKLAKKKVAAKKRAASGRQTGSSDKSADRRIKATTKAGKRTSKKTSLIKYKVKDPKTGKMVWKTVRRKNANQHVKAGQAGGKKYTERRANRTDKGKFL
jgi:adenylate kinase